MSSGEFKDRPTQDCDIEIIAALPHADGSVTPIVIGAGSFDDFKAACGEADESAQATDPSQANPESVRAKYVIRRMAEAGGVTSQLAFYTGATIGQMIRAEEQSRPAA
ncbi:MAG: hypothetical protein AAB971_01745 [Patescibacteria group bacterium]